MIKVAIEKKTLERRLDAATAIIKKGSIDMCKEMGNVFIGQAFKVTPPAAKELSLTEAKKRQEERIRWDLLGDDHVKNQYFVRNEKLRAFSLYKGYRVSPFIVVEGRVPKNMELVDPRAHLKKFGMRRRYRGMSLNWHGPRQFVRASALRAEVNRRIRRVGRLSAGWLAGARLSKRKSIPAWIARHSPGEGSAVIYANRAHGYVMEITNEVPYHQKELDQLIGVILDKTEAAMKKRARAILRNQLKKAA